MTNERGTVTVVVSLNQISQEANDYVLLSNDHIWSNVQSALMDAAERRLFAAAERRQIQIECYSDLQFIHAIQGINS